MQYAALFDLDGVIIDSESRYTVFWDGIEHIYPTDIPDFAMAIKGTNLTSILSNYSEQSVRDDIVARLQEFELNMDLPLYPGAVEFLDSLSEAGVARALVTSSADDKMEVLWRRHPSLRDRFEAVVTGSMVKKSKPDPEGYLTAAKLLGFDPSDCFVFEDSVQGLQAGRASGATVIALATTNPRSVVARYSDHVLDGIGGFTVAEMIGLKENISR